MHAIRCPICRRCCGLLANDLQVIAVAFAVRQEHDVVIVAVFLRRCRSCGRAGAAAGACTDTRHVFLPKLTPCRPHAGQKPRICLRQSTLFDAQHKGPLIVGIRQLLLVDA